MSTPPRQLEGGKVKALIEFCHFVAKSRGFEGPMASSAVKAAEIYTYSMIEAIFDQKMVAPEDPFDEAECAIQQNSPPVIHQQLRKAEAKAGVELEVLKFLAALVYEFRIAQVLKVARLCEKMNKISQMEMAHFFSFMAEAVRAVDLNWWHVLFTPYDDSELNNLGVSICSQAMTPHKTPSRSKMNERPLFDSPVGKVLNSPSGRDHLAAEYERRIKQEKALNEDLNALLLTASNETNDLKAEVDRLKEKIAELKTQREGCGEKCPNLSESSKLRVTLNIRDNQLRTKTAEFNTLAADFEEARANESRLRVTNAELLQKNELLAEESGRMSERITYLLEMNEKYQTLQNECEDLRLRLSLQQNEGAELEKLRRENDEMFKKLKSSGVEVGKSSGQVGQLKKLIEEQKAEIAALRRQTAAAPSPAELEAARSNLERLSAENTGLKQQMRELEARIEEERSRADSKENQKPAEGGGNKAELDALRANLRQMSEDLGAAKKEAKKWAEKFDDERVRAEGLAAELSELKRKQKAAVQSGRRVERGPLHESAAVVHTPAAAPPSSSSRKSNGARYSSTVMDPPARLFKVGRQSGDDFREEDRSHVLKERNQRVLPHMKSSLIDNKVALE